MRMRKMVSLMIRKCNMKSPANLFPRSRASDSCGDGQIDNSEHTFCMIQQRKGEVKLENYRMTSSALHFDWSQVHAVVVFLVLCKSVRGWKSKNYGLQNALAIRGNSSCKGRGTELGKRTIYWPLTHTSVFAKQLQIDRSCFKGKKKNNNVVCLCFRTLVLSFLLFLFIFIFRKGNQNDTSQQ